MEKGERKREGNACIHPQASCNILLGDRAYSVLLKLDSVSFSLGGRLAFDTKDLFLCQKKNHQFTTPEPVHWVGITF